MATTTLEIKEGGAYNFELTSQNGQTWKVNGVYKTIVKNTKLEFTWNTDDVAKTLVSVEFKDRGGETEIFLKHTLLPNEEQVQEHTWGWNGCLDNLTSQIQQ